MYKKFNLWALVVVIFMACSPVHAGVTFNELTGRFSMDVPDGYKQKETGIETFYIFDGEGGRFVALFEDGVYDLDASYQSAMSNFDGVLEETKTLELVTLDVNDKPAKLGVYSGTAVSDDGARGNLYLIVISTVMDKGSFYVACIMSNNDYDAWREKVKDSFKTIRESGASKTGVRNIKPVG